MIGETAADTLNADIVDPIGLKQLLRDLSAGDPTAAVNSRIAVKTRLYFKLSPNR